MFTRENFLLFLGEIITTQTSGGSRGGVGYLKTKDINLLADLRTSGGLTLTAGTNPLVASLETNALGVQWAAGDSTKGSFQFAVPIDYDQGSDTLILSMIVNSAGNTNAPTITANIYNKRSAAALSADLAPAASVAIPKSATAATAASEVTITLQGAGLKAGDVLTILLAPGTHATDAVNLYGMSVRFYSSLVGYYPSLR